MAGVDDLGLTGAGGLGTAFVAAATGVCRVEAIAPDEDVGAVEVLELIVTAPPAGKVRAVVAREGVVALSTEEDVCAVAADEDVVAERADERVAADTALDRVVTYRSDQEIIAFTTT